MALLSFRCGGAADVLLQRIESRTTNDYGKTIEERERIINDISDVERLLRATCTHEIDATQPIAGVVAELVAIGEDAASGRRPAPGWTSWRSG